MAEIEFDAQWQLRDFARGFPGACARCRRPACNGVGTPVRVLRPQDLFLSF